MPRKPRIELDSSSFHPLICEDQKRDIYKRFTDCEKNSQRRPDCINCCHNVIAAPGLMRGCVDILPEIRGAPFVKEVKRRESRLRTPPRYSALP
jgi:hypothetical protein